MGKITIVIETENAAFEQCGIDGEVARILYKLAENIDNGHEPEKLRDINGNTVGSVSYE